MTKASKDDKIMLEQAYLSIYEKKTHEKPEDEKEDEENETVEEETEEDGEDDTMAAAVSVQQTASDVEKRGDKPSQKLQKAEQESERYIDKKIASFKQQ